ncbi:ShlB/FhaC/HecB family hemolysin secretion/activation protein [Pantoea sp. KPR_PJ]|uniref:ShlB/FhaC/HecB family hemolysin secretion/activation protein n=1 Tax=Pantoea sp. KPR_PJ TaxID=2738375 RepID=UPI003529B5FC
MEKYINTRSVIFALALTLPLINPAWGAGKTLPGNVITAQDNYSASQIEQDKVRKQALQNQNRDNRSTQQEENKSLISFPSESPCYLIEKVIWTQDDASLRLKSLNYFTRQAEGKCLGIQGIRLLAHTLQNEIIRLGYITTRINMPEQDLKRRQLRFNIIAGKVGEIRLTEDSSDYINLNTTLPLHEGSVLNIRELEQGSFNLRRTPGSEVKINVIPGREQGQSDILIERHQDKPWQVSAWANDAGSKTTGRYQGGAALYLHNLTSLNDTLFFSAGHDVSTYNQPEGSNNRAAGYSVPWGFWWLDLYASESTYKQHIQGNFSDWMLKNKNSYYSGQLNRLLSHTVHQKTTGGLQLFNAETHYYYNNYELASMHKKSAGWKLIVEHQRYFNHAIMAGTLSYQKGMHWFNNGNTIEQKSGLISSTGSILSLDIKAAINFSLYDQQFNYSPFLKLQFSPDTLSSLDRLALGNRWSVRGFDGEYSLQGDQGWFLRNDISWMPDSTGYQPYLGIDIGQMMGHDSQPYYSGRTLAGGVLGLRGEMFKTHYDFFAGLPLHKPAGFETDPLTLGFSLQWTY